MRPERHEPTPFVFTGAQRERLAGHAAAILAGMRGASRERVIRLLRRCAIDSRPALTALLRRCCSEQQALRLTPDEVVVLMGVLATVAPERAPAPLDRALRDAGRGVRSAVNPVASQGHTSRQGNES